MREDTRDVDAPRGRAVDAELPAQSAHLVRRERQHREHALRPYERRRLVARAREQRRAGTAAALARATTADESLHLLLRSYIEFALQHSHLIGLLIGELDQLPEKERKASKQAQRDYLALWLRVLDEVRPGLDTAKAKAKITVCAALTVVDNAVRTGLLGRRPDLADQLAEIGSALLLPR